MSAMLRRILVPLASLRLTVLLFALSMVLIFAGTLAQSTQGIWQTIDGYFRSPIAWIEFQLFVPPQLARVPGALPFPGGYLIAGLLIINLIAAHAVRFKLTARRFGIVLLHAGLIVLLAGEFVTGLLADEGLMTIDVGGSSNYLEDVREVELAVIDRSAPDVDRVTALPQGLLEARTGGGIIRHADLPFSVRLDRWMQNSRLFRRVDEPTPATAGIGLEAVPEALPPVRGVDGGAVNAPSAYLTLLGEGDEPLGTWLVSLNVDQAQPVVIDGRSYDIQLRFRRTYKPYTLHLLEFRHDKFVGTETPRNFSSRVRLLDPSRDTDREVLIWMNHPLRYAGETFYQSAYKEGNTGTILQVVRNPGWLLPYIACAMVGGGMLIHFTVRLAGFLRRSTR